MLKLHLRVMKRTTRAPNDNTDYRPDGLWKEHVAVEIKSGEHSLRNLRAGMLQLAYYLAQRPDMRGVLVLTDTRITDAALKRERNLAASALRPEVLGRLSIAVDGGSEIRGIPPDMQGPFHAWLRKLIGKETRARGKQRGQQEDAIFLVLLDQWFQRKEPVTTRWLMDSAGCSYPTAAKALQQLGPFIRRTSDRKVKLWGFPQEHWQRVVANLNRVHPTVRYVDRSGQRRRPEQLLERAKSLGRKDLAIGGVVAARHYDSHFDLRGLPRLDLTLHCPDGAADLSFVDQLDPALGWTTSQDDAATLAVHVLHRGNPFFVPGKGALPLADRVTTLLDLHEGRIVQQANELLQHFVESAG